MNVVPLIDILLVLLVIFMIIPHKQKGLMAELPQPASEVPADPQPAAIVVQVFADQSLRNSRMQVVRTSTGTPAARNFVAVNRQAVSAPPGMPAPNQGTTNANFMP